MIPFRKVLRRLDRLILGPNPRDEQSSFDRSAFAGHIEILDLKLRETVSKEPSLWLTVKNTSVDDMPVQALVLLLVYTVNPGGTFMKGGNGTMSWKLNNAASANARIPSNATSEICIYEKDDPVELIWEDTLNVQNGDIGKDYQWLNSKIRRQDGLIRTLKTAPTTIWLEVRAPDWCVRNRNPKKELTLMQEA
ncbi:hypothetical protein [Parasedimentitalea maritima]|uniref:Uncharacterized protein n=1 Tax=Parasedimentitalea maritima TaxID=2578117 RepID=A0A6A4RLP2_9RHOB|nr:hypothetical protein [Zongyanglinia marina]KAE9631517.1 hypothetical protein GP644_04145 [Zongyanglinia marina]